MILLGVMAGGAAGALARYLVDIAVASRFGHRFAWGTLVVNVVGSGLLGFVTGLALYHGLPSTPEIVVGSGFCGGFTTFSTHTVDTVKLAEAGVSRLAVGSVLANLLMSVAAAAIGLALASL